MEVPQPLIDAVRNALKVKAREGKTTKKDVRVLVYRRMEKAGGPTRFLIGGAMLHAATIHLIDMEVGRQMKMGLTEHETLFCLPAHTPAQIIAALGKVPRWIAISEGGDANWVPSLQATPQDWFKNAELKEKKARQTGNRANESMDIGRFLAMNKFASLEEALAKGA